MREDLIKKYRKKLEVAINEVLTDAPEIKGTIDKIREEGFDVFLMVEATIGFNRCDEASDGASQEETDALELTSQDHRFLKQLKISPE